MNLKKSVENCFYFYVYENKVVIDYAWLSF